MFERFSDRARHVVVLAQEEARNLNHNYIGTEHILLGLIRETEGVAAKVLASMNVSTETVRIRVEQIVGEGKGTPTGYIPFTPNAKELLELSLRETLQLGHNYIGTGHILLGLVKEDRGVGIQVLRELSPSLPAVREAVLEAFASGPSDPSDAEPAIYDEEVTWRLAGAVEGSSDYVSMDQPTAYSGPLHPTMSRLRIIGFVVGLAGCALYVISSFLPYYQAPTGFRSYSAVSLESRGGPGVAVGALIALYGVVAILAMLCTLGLSTRAVLLWAVASLATSAAWGLQVIGNAVSIVFSARALPVGFGYWGMFLGVMAILVGTLVATVGASRMRRLVT